MELSGQILVKAYHTINLAADPSQASANHPETIWKLKLLRKLLNVNLESNPAVLSDLRF